MSIDIDLIPSFPTRNHLQLKHQMQNSDSYAIQHPITVINIVIFFSHKCKTIIE